MDAARERSIDVMNALLGAGANVNARNYLGLTALHSAAQKGNVAAVSELLKSGTIRATRSQMMISVTLDGFPYLDQDFTAFIVDEQTIISHSDHVQPYSQRTKRDKVVYFFSRQRLQNLESWQVQTFIDDSVEIQECRIWADGMTALDIADIRKDTDCSSLLETVPGMSRSEYSTTDIGEYMADLFGLPNMEAVLEEVRRREYQDERQRRKTKSNTHITSPHPNFF